MLYCRNSHPHGSHYNPIMQQPALLAGHVTLPSNQTLNVGVAHVMRQPSTNNNNSSKKNKQHQMSARYSSSHWQPQSIPKSSSWLTAFDLEEFGHHHLRVLTLFSVSSGTCQPTRCHPLRRCCHRSAPSG